MTTVLSTQHDFDVAIIQLREQQEAVAHNHLKTAPKMEGPSAACLVQRWTGTSIRTLGEEACRGLAWVIAEEREFITPDEEADIMLLLGNINDEKFDQFDALWYLSRAITLLEKMRDEGQG